MGIVRFNGVNSRDLGVEVETFPSYEYPEKEYQVYHVPGRNGDIVIDTNTYKNVSRTYRINAATRDRVDYYKLTNSIVEWLHSSSGYARLEDSYEPDFYRLAYYKDGGSISNIFNQAGQATIKFICKPQRFYKKGELPVLWAYSDNDGTEHLQNETGFSAKPLIKVIKSSSGSEGTIWVGSYSLKIKTTSAATLYIDCELQDAYSLIEGQLNQNSNIELNSGEFPVLKPGSNTITFTSGISYLEITPRWFTI